jgi:alkanesulfonate monooxygenase SsuD/methylene tetrahydromethanopterin reductase-like flavin-dependent oxidoreductase (luciferase family)
MMKRKRWSMKFGITIKPDLSVERIVALTRQAEEAGFEYGWIFDSHVLWKEPYPLLTLMANATRKMRLGPCVTNPAVRDLTVTASLFATLNLISGGRMDLGIGRGDSSRRVLGKKPVTPAELERAVGTFRELTSGLGFVWQGAKEAGRDPKSVEIMAAAPVWVSDDLALARQRVRWFPALVSNHVVDRSSPRWV